MKENNMEWVVFVILSISWSSTAGNLIGVGDDTVYCSNSTAEFRCTNFKSNFLFWVVTSPNADRSITIALVSETRPEGTIEEFLLGGSTIVVNVTSANNTFIRATLIILNPASINGSRIECNNEMISLTVSSASDLLPPKRINISLSLNFLNISWKSTINDIYSQKIALPEQWMNWTMQEEWMEWELQVQTSSVTYLINATAISIFICSNQENASTFHIDSCLFRDINSNVTRRYILELQKNWTIVENSPLECQFEATCDSMSQQWIPDGCTGNNSIESTSKRTFFNLYTTSQSSMEKPNLNLALVIIPISIVAIVIIVLIIILVVAVMIIKVTRNKTKPISSEPCHSETGHLETTYLSLSHKKIASTKPRQRCHENDSNLNSEDAGQYSCIDLNHNTISTPANSEYGIAYPLPTKSNQQNGQAQYSVLELNDAASPEVQSNGYCSTSSAASPKVVNHLKYADIGASDFESTGVNTIHMKVDYSDVRIKVRPEDESLNLDSLLIQLNPISKDFRLLGSMTGISQEILAKISDSCADSYDALVEVCDAWLTKCRQEKTTPTWTAVADILSLIGRDKMAQDIMQVYVTGKLPVEVDMKSVCIQGEVRKSTPPPVPHRNEDSSSEVEFMTVTSVMKSRHGAGATIDEPPPLPDRPPDLLPGREEPQEVPPVLPPKVPAKVQTKPTSSLRNMNEDDENKPSLPPRPSKNN